MRIRDRLTPGRPALEAHDIVTRAIQAAGSSTFDSHAWSAPLEVLARSLDREASLHSDGRRTARRALVDLLSARCRTERSDATTPVGSPATAVLAVLGIDGSGASELARHMAAHTGRFDSEFVSMDFERRWHVPTYAEWLAEADLGDLYRSVAARMTRWPLGFEAVTGASHLERLELFAGTFPAVPVVVVHRDPMACLADTFDGALAARRAGADHADPSKLQRYRDWRAEILLDRFVESRERLRDSTFIDLDAGAVAADRVAAAAALVALAGDPHDTAGLEPFVVRRPTADSIADSTAGTAAGTTRRFERYRNLLGTLAA